MDARTRQLNGDRKLRPHPGPATPSRILFINQYYWPDRASTAQHLADLAESLAERGIECHVLCGKGGYQGDRSRVPSSEVHNGVHIHRVGSTSLGRRSTLRRMTDYLSFYACALVAALRLTRFDTTVTLTTPPIIGLIGMILGRLKGSRHVFWSMDLHPDAGIALGLMSRRNPIVAVLSWISDRVYRAADRVVVLGPYMADRIAAKGVRPNRIKTIPVWSRGDEIYPWAEPRESHPLRKSLGLGSKFIAMYSGNMGLAHSFDDLMTAAVRLREREDIVFLFVGDGPRKAEILKAKSEADLGNVILLDYFPREQLHLSLSLADVHLMSMRREMIGIVVPCKLYGAMASARPSLFVGPEHCETADTIREAACGFVNRLGEPDGIVESIEGLAADLNMARTMGEHGRTAFLQSFEREACCVSWSLMLNELEGDAGVVPMPSVEPRRIKSPRKQVGPAVLRRIS